MNQELFAFWRSEILEPDAVCPVCGEKIGGHIFQLTKPADFHGDFYAHYDCVQHPKKK